MKRERMRSVCFIFGLILPAFQDPGAQHCPFDGSSMIVIHVTNKEGKSLEAERSLFTLQEIENKQADSCTYAKGLLEIPFEKAQTALLNKYNNSWAGWSQERSKGCAFLDPGYYVVVLNMAQTHCMIKDKEGFKNSKRNFQIRWMEKDVRRSIPVTADRIYRLCTDAGSWKRIEAITITLPH